jgi:hypothetical protein
MNSNVKSLVVAAVGLSMGLAGMHGGALAQIKEAPIITGNVDGTCVTAPSVNTTGANSGDWTITCGDISPGAGMTVIGPPAVVSDPAPMVAPEPVVEPANEPAPVAEPAPETTEPVTSDAAVATETDLDGDNYPDELEWDLGLDPNNVDTDADGVADGDELNIYGTEPTLADTDGDGGTDGGELFDTRTDPLVWNDFSTEASSQSVAQEAAPAPVQSVEPLSEKEMVALGQESSEDLSATNGDAAALGTGNASAAPGNVTRGGVPVSGAALLGPDGKYSVNEISPPNVSVSGTTSTPPVIEPAPGTEAAPEPVVETVETSEPVAADNTVASAEDADADNYADAAELEIGLDPSNSDTDGDGVADGDEATIYFTDPFTRDSDGDSLSDGEELFSLLTDPLVYDANGVSDGEELPV